MAKRNSQKDLENNYGFKQKDGVIFVFSFLLFFFSFVFCCMHHFIFTFINTLTLETFLAVNGTWESGSNSSHHPNHLR